MFVGFYEHNIDEKGRLTIPSSFREQLPNGVFIMQGFDGNLTVYSKESFEQLAKGLDRSSITNSDQRLLRRFLFSKTAQLDFDTAGRILIPSFLRTYAKLDGNVIITGANDNFEIWSPDLWQKQETMMQDFESNTSRWSSLDVSTKWD